MHFLGESKFLNEETCRNKVRKTKKPDIYQVSCSRINEIISVRLLLQLLRAELSSSLLRLSSRLS